MLFSLVSSGSEMPSDSSEISSNANTVDQTNNDNFIPDIPSPNLNRAEFDFYYLISVDNEDIREEREREFQDRLSKDRNVPSEYLNQMLSLIGSDVIPQANKLPITSFVHNDHRLCSKLEHNR